MDDACPLCGAPRFPGATACANCGAVFRSPATGRHDALLAADDPTAEGEGDLVQELESLRQEVEEETQAVDRTLGELEALVEIVSAAEERLAPTEADLAGFVRKPEAGGASGMGGAADPSPPPRRNPIAPYLLVVSAIACATGLFLLPGSFLSGVVTSLAGVALFAVGGGLYASRPASS